MKFIRLLFLGAEIKFLTYLFEWLSVFIKELNNKRNP